MPTSRYSVQVEFESPPPAWWDFLGGVEQLWHHRVNPRLTTYDWIENVPALNTISLELQDNPGFGVGGDDYPFWARCYVEGLQDTFPVFYQYENIVRFGWPQLPIRNQAWVFDVTNWKRVDTTIAPPSSPNCRITLTAAPDPCEPFLQIPPWFPAP